MFLSFMFPGPFHPKIKLIYQNTLSVGQGHTFRHKEQSKIYCTCNKIGHFKDLRTIGINQL